MARFLIATFPATGHVNPALPIARALIERGHAVVWYTGRQFQPAIEATGAQFTPIMAASDPADRSFDKRFPDSQKLQGLKALKFGLKYIFLDEAPRQVADLQRILRTFRADVILSDTAFMGAGMLRELGGPPWATYGITALTLSSRDTAPFGTGLSPATSPLERLRNQLLNALSERVLFRDVLAHAQQVRARMGLPPDRAGVLNMTLSPYLYLHSSTEVFEYPRSDLAPQVHFIGPLLPATPPDFVPPAWWGDLHSGRPVVLVNQGTVATNLNDLIVPALHALADEDVLVVATTGGKTIEHISVEASPANVRITPLPLHPTLMPYVSLLADQDDTRAVLPLNARVEPFIPFGALLPHVDVMVTNGGYGGVQFALAHGVPLVVAGTTEEKPEIAARVAWSGAGINLKTKTPTPAQIRAAVRAVLDTPRYRQNAARIQADYARHNAPAEAASLLERLAETRQPVLREEPTQPYARMAAEVHADVV